jgi:sterol desaturase/sphingolipid hydroxylase (fatty acid hydroxylase superfamily)
MGAGEEIATAEVPREQAGELALGLLGHFGAPLIMIAVAQVTHFAPLALGLSFVGAALFGVGLMLVAERARPSVALGAPSVRQVASGLFHAFVVGLGFGMLVVVSTYWLLTRIAPSRWQLSGWAALAIALLASDATFYVLHRFFNHGADATAFHRWCRARHSVHHSVKALDFYRGGIFSALDPVFIGSELALAVVGAALGLPLPSVMFAYGLLLLFQNTHHVNHSFDIGPLRYLFMDNHAHKLHHCRRGTRVNLAAVLSIWDRLLGTYYEDRARSAAYLQHHRIALGATEVKAAANNDAQNQLVQSVPQASNRVWNNWLGNVVFEPERIFYPRSRQDLVAIVNQARVYNKKIRVAAAGHSTSPLVPTDDYLVDMRDLNRVIACDAERKLVIIEAGITIEALDERLRENGLAVPSSVVLTSVRYGGVLATGSHGSGYHCATLSDFVEAMTIVTASGAVVCFSEATHGAEMMNAVRLNLGLFGLIYDITLRVESDFNLEVTDEQAPLSLMRDPQKLRKLVEESYLCDVFWFPLSDALWVKRARRTDAAAVPLSLGERMIEVVHAGLAAMALRIVAKMPSLTRFINQRALSMMVPKPKTIVREAARAIHYKNHLEAYTCQLTSFAVKVDENFENPARAWCLAMDRALELAKEKKYPLTVTLQMRFIGSSRALLSPAHGEPGEHHCYLELLSARHTEGAEPFFDEIATQWMADERFAARPHWGKYFHSIPNVVPYLHRRMDDNIQRFNAVRESLDPKGMFLTPHLRRIFYP